MASDSLNHTSLILYNMDLSVITKQYTVLKNYFDNLT